MDDAESARARVHAVVHGRVQGVGFRFFAQREASSRGISGWVRNRRDGAVEVLAEGPREVLEGYLDALRRGPSGARVDRVEAAWTEPKGTGGGFRIHYL